jgi:peptidoglycan/xylan/chitin deacetylase (PgdA/CDA1 family)
MRVRGAKIITRLARRLRARLSKGALIIGYHRVAEGQGDPYSICVSPAHFAAQIAVLRRRARVVSLGELAAALEGGRPPRGAVAVTFDDGYADNLLAASPILERHGAPATFFISTGCLGGEFWWDELARLLLTAQAPPETLRLEGLTPLPSGAAGSEDRRQLLQALHAHLMGIGEAARCRLLEQMRVWAHGAVAMGAARAMSPDQLVSLAHHELVEIGAHTVSHPSLKRLDRSSQQWEIRQSKAHLEKLLAREVVGFSYPHGALSARTVAYVREAGYRYACCSHTDAVRRGSDRFRLPRLWAPDCDGPTFERWLGRWLPA